MGTRGTKHTTKKARRRSTPSHRAALRRLRQQALLDRSIGINKAVRLDALDRLSFPQPTPAAATTTPAQPAERAMSLRPSDQQPYTPARSDDRSDRLSLNLTRPARQALGILKRATGEEAVETFCRVSWRGLDRIRALPEARIALAAYLTVRDAGGDLEAFENWSFRPPGWDGLMVISMNYVAPALLAGCRDLAAGFGMPRTVMYGLSISFGAIGEVLPTTIAEQLAEHVVAFRHALQKRAAKLHGLAASLAPVPQRVYREPQA
jgi:hypothetical protein